MSEPGANGAVPWIIFHRDREAFRSRFPNLVIDVVEPHTPLRYLLSGGVSYRQLVPGFLFPFFRFIDKILPGKWFAMFAYVKVVKR